MATKKTNKEKLSTAEVNKNEVDKEKKTITITQEEAEAILKSIKQPIYLQSPLKYKEGEVVIERLSQAERDQIIFKFITNITAYVEQCMMTLNDILLLTMENSRRNGVNVKNIINKSIIQTDTLKDNNTGTMNAIKDIKENK